MRKFLRITSVFVIMLSLAALWSCKSGDDDDKPQAYFVTVQSSQNGRVSAGQIQFPLTKVVLTVTPNEGYGLESITVRDSFGNPVMVSNNSFIMPLSNVTVSATFTAVSENAEKSSEVKSSEVKTSKVKFDFANARAIAQLEHASSSGARAVTEVNSLGDFVKILEDGSMENAITVAEGSSLSDIVAVYKSPLATSKDVFVVFKNKSNLGSDYDQKTGVTTYSHIGQLVCVHEDGSIADVLNVDSKSVDYWNAKYIGLKTDSIQFDVNGNLYFVSASGGYNLKGEASEGEMIYQYNPGTKELTLMVAAVAGTTYYKLQIDKAGQYIFVSGSRSDADFLRAIPIGNPNAFVNVYYSSNGSLGSDQWVYDDNSGIMYFIAVDGNDRGLFTASKAKGFKDKKFQRTYIGDNFEWDLLDSFSARSEYYWSANVLTDEKFDAVKAVNYILGQVYSKGVYDYSEPDENGRRSSQYKQLKLTTDKADIRFDLYAGEAGALRALYLLSAGKKNAEALKALDSNMGRAPFYNIYNIERFSSKTSGGTSYYENNFLADILYEKDSDKLLKDSDKVILSYTDSDGTSHEIKGRDIFKRNSYGYTERGDVSICGYNGLTDSDYTFAFSKKFYKNNVLDTSALLEYFFSYCEVEGTKEFRLTAFKDDPAYGSLYTDLTDAEALKWLASDVNRMNLLVKLIASKAKENYRVDWVNNESVYHYPYYQGFMNFIAKTCFISGSEIKATKWNNVDDCIWISYTGNSYSDMRNGKIYEFEGVSNLSVNENGVFGIASNVFRSSSNNQTPYFCIIQIADNKGKLVELQNKLPLPNGKVVKSQTDSEKLLLQYSLLNESGGELGYHHIYSVNLDSGAVTNCFENVPNRNGLEVVTFSAAGDMLYYSAVRGTSVENGIVRISTNEYNPLSVTRKMVAVYTLK